MNRFIMSILILTALSAPAMAQNEPPAADQSQQPCTRSGGSQLTVGGVDFAEMRCALSVDDARIGDLDKQLRNVTTSLIMARNDLAALKKTNEQRAKDLDEWFKGWFGSEAK
jgi:TolA-binding protein